MDERPPHDPRSPDAGSPVPGRARRRPRGLRIASVLVLVAFVPMAAITMVSAGAARDARAAESAASRAGAESRRALHLVELDAAIFDEMVWRAVVAVSELLAAPDDLVERFIGVNPAAEGTLVVARVDALVAATGSRDVEEALVAARAADLDAIGVVSSYQPIRTQISVATDQSLEQLIIAVNAASTDDPLLLWTFAVLFTVDIQRSIAEQFIALFALEFDLRDAPAGELRSLMWHRVHMERALEGLLERLRTDLPGPILDGPLLAPYGPLMAVVDDAISSRLTAAVDTDLPALDASTLLDRAASFAAVYRAADEANAAAIATSRVVAAGLGAEIERLEVAAAGGVTRAQLIIVALLVATGITVLVATRFIVVPIRLLESTATHLRGDGGPTEIEVRGPIEVRAAAVAMSEAARHVELLTTQASALAAGELDADVLDQSITGGLGTALHSTVGALRAGMAEQDELRRRLAHEATHDGLTHLANRTETVDHLTRALARCRRSGSRLAVLFVDLDRFKEVNDTFGHHAGDVVLVAVAHRLVEAVREGDLVGRIGGDEFLVVAEPIDGIDDAMALADRVLTRCCEPIEVDSIPVVVGASIGLATSAAGDRSADDLLREADLALYRAKARGRGVVST